MLIESITQFGLKHIDFKLYQRHYVTYEKNQSLDDKWYV